MKVFGSIGNEVAHLAQLIDTETRPGLYDGPDPAVCVYRQFVNNFMKVLMMGSEEILGRKCVARAAKLVFLAGNTLSPYKLLFLKDKIVEVVDEIDFMLSLER